MTCGEGGRAPGVAERSMRGQGLRLRLLEVLEPSGAGRRSTCQVDTATNVAACCIWCCQGGMWHQACQGRHAAVGRNAWDRIDHWNQPHVLGTDVWTGCDCLSLRIETAKRNGVNGALSWM